VVVEIDDQRAIDRSFAAQLADRDRNVGNRAEPFGLVGLGMVKAASRSASTVDCRWQSNSFRVAFVRTFASMPPSCSRKAVEC
jgi:hypothetical protein